MVGSTVRCWLWNWLLDFEIGYRVMARSSTSRTMPRSAPPVAQDRFRPHSTASSPWQSETKALEILASVYPYDLTGDMAGGIGDEEGDHIGDVLRFAEATQTAVLAGCFLDLFG